MEGWEVDEEDFGERRHFQTYSTNPSTALVPIENSISKDVVLCIEVLSVEGLPLSRLTYFHSLRCEMVFDSVLKISHFCSKRNASSYDSRTMTAVWNIPDFYGPDKVSFNIKSSFGGFSDIKGRGSLQLSDLLGKQWENISNLSSWGTEFAISMREVGPPQPQLFHSVPVLSSQKQRDVFLTSAHVPDSLLLKFRFLLFRTSSCLQSPVTQHHHRNDLLHLIALAPVTLLKKVLFVLGHSSVLCQALRQRSSDGLNALDTALKLGRVDVVYELLSRAGHWCFQGTQYMHSCCVHHAVMGGNIKCLYLLLRFLKNKNSIVGIGSNWNSTFAEMMEWKDQNGNSPLSLACSLPHGFLVAKLLIAFGSKIDQYNPVTLQTPFMLACECGNAQLVSFLLRSKKSKAEQLAAVRSNSEVIVPNSLARLKCSPSNRDQSGQTAILLAARNGHLIVVRNLCSLGVSLLDATISGDNIFHCAASSGSMSLCEYLVSLETKEWAKYRIDARKKSLLRSMYHRPRILLQRNSRGLRPDQIALESGHPSLAEFLRASSNEVYVEDSIANVVPYIFYLMMTSYALCRSVRT